MARWTGDVGIASVLEAADAWEERCLVKSLSILTERPLWTVENLADVLSRYLAKPILGSGRDFLNKLEEQLQGASAPVIQLASEVLWFLFLFPSPSVMKPDTKREAKIMV